MAPPPENEIIRFEPPARVYLLDLLGNVLLNERLTKPTDLHSGIGVAIPNPWHEGQFVPGKAHGEGLQYVMEVGESYASIIFDAETGWVCRGLIKKATIDAAVVPNPTLSFTDKLVKRAAKKKRTS